MTSSETKNFMRRVWRASALIVVCLAGVWSLAACSYTFPVPSGKVVTASGVPSTSPVPAQDAAAVAQERLERSGWWLPETASDVTVTLVDDQYFVLALDVSILEFTAPRTDVMAMVPKGGGSPFFEDSSYMREDHLQMLAQTPLPDAYRFVQSNSQVWPFYINVLILPDEGDAPNIIVLSYQSPG